MSAYLVVRVRVDDPAAYEEYKKLAAPSIAKFGGRYLVRGGATETLEGQKEANRLVVVEFPSMADARRWYASPDYQKAVELRKNAAEGQFVLAQGVDE